MGTVDDLAGTFRNAGSPSEPAHYWPALQAQSLFAWPGHEDRVAARPCPVASRETPRTLTLPAPVTLSAECRAALEALCR